MNFILKKIYLLFSFTIVINLINAQCHYLIDMQDSWGDGWNGASVEVNVNGAFATSFSLAGGNAGLDSIATLNNDVVDFSFVSGNWDTELSFQIYDPLGNQIFNQTQFANNNGNDAFLLSDTSNSTCVPQYVNVTFQVDMSKVTASFTTPEISGSWNNFCGNCDQMADPDGDDVWEKTISLYTGNYEYKFSTDSLNIEEVITSTQSCSNGSLVLPRRFIAIGAQDVVLPVVCWESCEACNDFPQPPVGITCTTGNTETIYTDDCDAQGNWTGDFDNANNGYWQVGNGGTGSGGTGPNGAHSGSDYFYFEASAGGLSSATIITPPISLTNNYDDAELTFWMHARGPGMGILEVGLANNPNGPFNTVYSQFGETHANANDPWSQIGINVGSYVGQNLYVAFTLTRDLSVGPAYQSDLAIDLVEVISCSTCPSPNSLTASNITSSTVDLSWISSGNETEWMLYYNGLNFSTTSNPTTLPNLSPNTTYSCQVSAVCAAGDTSSQSLPISFTTGCAAVMAPVTEYFDSIFSPCWSQESLTDDFDWTLNNGDTWSNDTGPDDDVSIGGEYMFTEASAPRQDGEFAIMYSEEIDLSNLTNPQLHFYTHMYGSAIGEIQIDVFDNGSYVTVFNKIGEQGDFWAEEIVSINPSSTIVHFRITGILGVDANGDTWPGDIAIDEFSVIEAIANDIEASGIINTSGCGLSNSEQIGMKIKNNGIISQSNFNLSYKINGGSPVIENFTNTLNAGDSATYYFTTTADLSNNGLYNIELECLLTNDQITSNDVHIASIENYTSPSAPTTTNDTICNGDTAHLMATTTEGLIKWYSDQNATNALTNNMVSPSTTTTYYAAVQSAEFFIDDFESYPSGSLIAQSSPNWATYSGNAGGGQDDALVSNTQMASGNNSIYLNQLNDDDIYLPFNQVYNSGNIEIIMDVFVGSTAHMNVQGTTTPGALEIFELRFNNSSMMEFDIGTTTLLGSYPGPGNWFKLKLNGDLNSSIWTIYINGAYQGGATVVDGDEVASMNFRPEIGDEFYLDNVEWYAISDDDCLGPTSPVIVNIEDCSSINESLKTAVFINPNPTNGGIHIESSEIMQKIIIQNIEGKLIYEENKINTFSYNYNLENEETGMYFIKIITKNGLINKKVILK